jgi:hypothetical protein
MIKTDLHPKIEASFASEKELFLKKMTEVLELKEPEEELGVIVEEITKIFRNWAENKEQLLDDEGRSRMSFLDPRPAVASEESEAAVVLSTSRSFTPQYNQTKDSLLPLQMKVAIRDLLSREQQSPEKKAKLTEASWTQLSQSEKILFEHLQRVIERLEHANRWVFAVQQLSESDVKKTKFLSNTNQKA